MYCPGIISPLINCRVPPLCCCSRSVLKQTNCLHISCAIVPLAWSGFEIVVCWIRGASELGRGQMIEIEVFRPLIHSSPFKYMQSFRFADTHMDKVEPTEKPGMPLL